MRKFYLAYGSNMNLPQMFSRCRNAVPVGRGVIDGHRLSFRQSASGFYASVDKVKGFQVPVVVWSISEEDEKMLDRYEGCPAHYQKKVLPFRFLKEAGERGRCRLGLGIAYILPESRKQGSPSQRYLNLLWEAYERFGFPLEELVAALRGH